MTTKKEAKRDSVTIPRWLYNQMKKDCDLVRHLAHYRGHGWVRAVRKEMESDQEYHLGAFK